MVKCRRGREAHHKLTTQNYDDQRPGEFYF